MKKLIAVLSCVASVGALTAMGMYAPPSQSSVEYQPKPGVMSPAPRVMQDASCTPTPTPDPGGHLKKTKAPTATPNKQ